jgi:hypothetical protein
MALQRDFIDAVESRNKRKVRVMIKDSFMIDPSMRTLNEMLSFAEREITDLYEAHEGAPPNNDKTAWDEKYFNSQLGDLLFNFSRERIDHLEKVCAYHYKGYSYSQKPADDKEKQPHIPQKKVGTVAAAAGIAATIGGIIISKPLLIAAGIACTVIGGIMVATDREEKV